MRKLLHILAATITQQPREFITPVWSKSWVCNVFRAFEYVFGRRAGIRFEGSTQEGITIHGTWEHFLAHQEGRLRALKNPFAFKLVPLPLFVAVTPNGRKAYFDPKTGRHLPNKPIFNFAIAYVTSGVGASIASTQTISVTVSGSNTYIFAMTNGVSSSSGTNPLNTSTFAGVNMSSSSAQNIGGSGSNSIWARGDYLASPTAGTNNYVSSETGGQFIYGGACLVYSGVNQGSPDAQGFSSFTSPNASPDVTVTLNTATTNCWMCMFAFADNGTLTASTNLTMRTGANDCVGGDSNGTIPAGSYSLTITGAATGTDHAGGYGYKFASISTATANPAFLLNFV